jgi:hypothetical protein
MSSMGGRILPVLWLASLAACASAPLFVMRPVNDGLLNRDWPELLRTRYQCENAVVGAVLQAVREGYAFAYRVPTEGDRGKSVCDLADVMWPVRVRAFEKDAGIVEEWEFQGRTAQQGRPAISANLYQTWVAYFEGAAPQSLRLVRLSPELSRR